MRKAVFVAFVVMVAALVFAGENRSQTCTGSNVDLTPSNWNFQFSTTPPTGPTPIANPNYPKSAWMFSFPTSGGVDYLVTPQSSLAGFGTLRMGFKVHGGGSLAPTVGTDSPPASVSLFVWRAGDNLSCQGPYASYRFWAGKQSITPGVHQVIDVSLSATPWTNCFGQSDPNGFSALLGNLAFVGMTFGGLNFDGHGVYAPSDASDFVLYHYGECP